jgi:hypothetical protein
MSWLNHWVSVRMSRANRYAWVSVCRAWSNWIASASSGPRWLARSLSFSHGDVAPSPGATACWQCPRTGAGCETHRHRRACRPRRPSARRASLTPHRRNCIVRLQPLPGGVNQMHAPDVGVAMVCCRQQIAVSRVDAASTPASTGIAPWKSSSCRPTRMADRSGSWLMTSADARPTEAPGGRCPHSSIRPAGHA